MNETITFLYLKDTGHILGGITRKLNPQDEIEATDMTGENFTSPYLFNPQLYPNYYGKVNVTIPSDRLATSIIDADMLVLRKPFLHYINKNQQGQDECRDFLSSSTPDFDTANPVSFDAEKVTITLKADVVEDTSVIVQVIADSGGAYQLVEGIIRKEASDTDFKKKVEITISRLGAGKYYVATFVAGLPVRIDDDTIT